MIAFLNAHVAGFTLSLPRAHCQHSFCCVHTSTLDVNQHKGMSLLFPRRGGGKESANIFSLRLSTSDPSPLPHQVRTPGMECCGAQNSCSTGFQSVLKLSTATLAPALDAGYLSAVGARHIPESKAISLFHLV